MGAAFNRNMASVSAKDEAKAVRQRVALEAAERELDLFCEQVPSLDACCGSYCCWQ